MAASAPSLFADVLRWPLIGRFLRWRHARTSLQLVMLALAAVIVLHGLIGPSLAPRNLATVLVWVHYRGLLILALLVAANLACTGCPLVLVRDLGRRVRPPRRVWPRRLRGKWLAILLMAGVLFVYEWQDLWASPRGTAWLVLGYFGAALAIDLTFTGATFCKHLCPIGQFNFVASTASPLEVRVRDLAVCRDCHTHDCIRGVRGGADARHAGQRGCELGLFLPAKVGNLDCTLCLDCVQACPRDNVALAPRIPAAELASSARRSGIGRLSRRPDLAGLAAVFTCAGLVNAFLMTAPAYSVQEALGRATGVRSEGALLGILFAAGVVALPLLLVAAAAGATRLLARSYSSWSSIAASYAWALVPIGAATWAAHYSFHLLTGVLTVVPVVQSAAADVFGKGALGAPLWAWAGLKPGAVYPIELGLVLLGLMGSLATAGAVAQREHPRAPLRAAAPWAALVVALACASIWVLSQPMEMRGTSL